MLHSRVDFTPYAGLEITGRPQTVLVRGRTVVEDGRLMVEPGFGRFLALTPTDPAAAPTPIEDSTPWLDS